jgi:hypothetical protein
MVAQKLSNLTLLAIEFVLPQSPHWATKHFTLRFGVRQSHLCPLTQQIPFNLSEQPEHGDHHLRLDLAPTIDQRALLHGNESNLLFDEAIRPLLCFLSL